MNKIMKKKISIIVATYNAEQVFEDLVRSIIPQKTNDIEFIVIDGGSKDRTVDIIERYCSFIDYWVSEPDKGIYDAWNKGIKASNGEWISFVGADDILIDDCIEKYLFETNKSKINFISSKILKVKKNLSPIGVRGEKWSSDMKKYCCIAHVGSLHHKSLFIQKGYFDTSFKITGDYDFLLRCYDIIKATFISEITAKVREGGISDSEIIKIAKETKYAKLKNKSRNKILCEIDYFISIIKFKIRHFIK